MVSIYGFCRHIKGRTRGRTDVCLSTETQPDYAPYSTERTIIVFGLNAFQKGLINQIAKETLCQVRYAEDWQDLLAYPAFFQIINLSKMDKESIETLIEVWIDSEDDGAVLLSHYPCHQPIEKLRQRIIVDPEAFTSKKLLKLYILNSKLRFQGVIV